MTILKTSRNDAEIALAALENREEFQELYLRYAEKIYRYFRYRTNSKELTEDLVSSVFIKAMDKLDTYNPEYAFSTWIFSLARNTLIDYWRSEHLNIEFDERIEQLPGQDLKQVLENKISVEQLMARVGSEEQILLKLRFLDDLTFEEMAEITGKSAGALRTRMHRLIKNLALDNYVQN